ncbi:MAG: hypothetical protein ABRQ37_28935 [Candidatus Eremiobacterota bacterium]
MLGNINNRLNTTELQKYSGAGKIKSTASGKPLIEENVKTSDIISIGAKPAAEKIIPFKANYAGLQERSINKHLESYTLHDSQTGDNYTLKANTNGVLAMFEEEPGNDTGRKLSLELKSSHTSGTGSSLLSSGPEEYYFFSR